MVEKPPERFERQVERLRSSGWLGRSQGLARLFDFLVDARRSLRSLREVEIAQEVFGQHGDLSGDASVRVYVHRLRKKLASFYDGPGASEPDRLILPLGEYRLDIETAQAPAFEPTVRARARPNAIVALLALLVAANVAGWAWWCFTASADKDLQRALRGPVWSAFDGRRPLIVVVGDYYIFGEKKGYDITRMIREFDVNSVDDLQRKLMEHPELQERYVDLDTTYTATGTTEALQYILPIVRAAEGSGKRITTIPSSDLTPEMLKFSDIVYVGYFSSLRLLEEPLLAGSRIKIGETYDTLVNRKSGHVFDSNAGPAGPEQSNVDYGYLRSFQGPSGNHILVIAGTRDIGVRQMAETATTPAFAAAHRNSRAGIEALYEVRGIGRTNISDREISMD